MRLSYCAASFICRRREHVHAAFFSPRVDLCCLHHVNGVVAVAEQVPWPRAAASAAGFGMAFSARAGDPRGSPLRKRMQAPPSTPVPSRSPRRRAERQSAAYRQDAGGGEQRLVGVAQTTFVMAMVMDSSRKLRVKAAMVVDSGAITGLRRAKS